jgi:hypothetical protein
MKEYTNKLYDAYSEKSEEIKKLLGSIKSMSNIPIEILSKIYARLYTSDSDFHSDLNKNLRLNKIDENLSYIKTLYDGVKLKSLPLATKNELYRCSTIHKDEINKIKTYMTKKIEGLPSAIVFCKSFLSFSKDRVQAEKFYEDGKLKNNLSKVLFILEKDNNVGYNLSTHGDIEKISFYPKEKEVLFFPFSSFEIKAIKENKNEYEIKLLYLGKYLRVIENDEILINNENIIPDSDFKKELIKVGIIKEEKIKNANPKKIIKEYKKYEKELKNFIIGEIEIGPEDINNDIQIINSYENDKRSKRLESKENDSKYENEKEIKENTEILIERHKHICDDQKIVDVSQNFGKLENVYHVENVDKSKDKSQDMKIYELVKKSKDVDAVVKFIKENLKKKEEKIVLRNEIDIINEKNKDYIYYTNSYYKKDEQKKKK